MADWRITGTYLEACNCEPGCGCNFVGAPNSPEGNCEALLLHSIEEGSSGGVELGGATVVWALWWPGAIHERGGHGHAFVDCETDEQFDALSRIWRGRGLRVLRDLQLDLRRAVGRRPIGRRPDPRRQELSLLDRRGGRGGAGPATQPGRRPGERRAHRQARRLHLERRGDRDERTMRVELPEMSYDVSGRHTVFADFDYANG